MEVDWTTFALEIINFLILVWILKRFFYHPVLDVIARRRAGIEKEMADAKAVEEKARVLEQQYENRLVSMWPVISSAQTCTFCRFIRKNARSSSMPCVWSACSWV